MNLIDERQQAIDAARAAIAGKKMTRAMGKKVEDLEIKEGNLDAFRKVLEAGGSIHGLRVANDIGSEVGTLVVEGEVTRIVYDDGESKEVNLEDLYLDEVATKFKIKAGSEVILQGKKQVITRALYPGQVEVDGHLYSHGQWEAPEPEVAIFSEVVEERTRGDYRFVIGKMSNGSYQGQLILVRGKTEETIFESEVCDRFNMARSEIVKKWHELERPLKAGDKVSFDPWFLAFAPENRKVYHPTSQECEIDDLLEDFQAGIPILQRIGVSEYGEIYSGSRRVTAAMAFGLTEVPIEVSSFRIRADFIDALISANRQRVMTPEIRARERQLKYQVCSQEARATQLAAIDKNIPESEKPKAEGSAWARTVADEPGISFVTAANQNKIITWADTYPQRELAQEVLNVFNAPGKQRTKTCLDLIKYAEEHGDDNALTAARVIASGEASSLPKAIARAKLEETKPPTKPSPRATPSGAIPAPSPLTDPGLPVPAVPLTSVEEQKARTVTYSVPDFLLRASMQVLGDLDIDICSGSQPTTDASMHFTGNSRELDGLLADWLLPQNPSPTTAFGVIFADNPDEWARAIAREFSKGHLGKGIFFFSDPSPLVRLILKPVAIALADLGQPVEVTADGRKWGKAPLTAFFVGGDDDWDGFAELFDAYGDVRIAYWKN